MSAIILTGRKTQMYIETERGSVSFLTFETLIIYSRMGPRLLFYDKNWQTEATKCEQLTLTSHRNQKGQFFVFFCGHLWDWMLFLFVYIWWSFLFNDFAVSDDFWQGYNETPNRQRPGEENQRTDGPVSLTWDPVSFLRRPSWLSDQNHLNKILFPHPSEHLNEDNGYPHDGRADKDTYRHDGRAYSLSPKWKTLISPAVSEETMFENVDDRIY